jgi:hypothetical protein
VRFYFFATSLTLLVDASRLCPLAQSSSTDPSPTLIHIKKSTGMRPGVIRFLAGAGR